MKYSSLATIAAGVLLIAVLTPLSQFLTIMTVNADVETGSPVAWAVGIVFSLLLVFGCLRWIGKRQTVTTGSMVVLYAMLTIAVPLMNLGLVRHVYLSATTILFHYLDTGNHTYRTAYNSLNDNWFPLVPTKDGLAWNKADRLLLLLRDHEAARTRDEARRQLTLAIQDKTARLAAFPESVGSATIDRVDSPEAALWEPLIAQLGIDEVRAVRALSADDLLKRLGLIQVLQNRYEEVTSLSSHATERLPRLLAEWDEFHISLLPRNYDTLDPARRIRYDAVLASRSTDERSLIEERTRIAALRFPELQSLLNHLGRADLDLVRNELTNLYLEQYSRLSEAELADLRQDFVFRSSREERQRMIRQDGRDAPNQNLHAFRGSLFRDSIDQQRMERQSFAANLGEVAERLPWNLWWKPLILWSALILTIFLFFMCLAEWLRRKWVDQENLSFPLVEMADHIIRHDRKLETAEDIRNPDTRTHVFHRAFIGGVTIGLLMLTLDAMNHYGLLHGYYVFQIHLWDTLFTTGALREILKLQLVISPILVGIAFLFSLQIGFSIWFTFLIYNFVVWAIRLASGGGGVRSGIQETLYAGQDAGRFFPYTQEQMMGAVLCLALVLIWKSWKSPPASAESTLTSRETTLPPRMTLIGLTVLPVLILGMLWNVGVTNLPLLLLFCGFAMAMVIASARVRAETGLPWHHSPYEFSKLPIIFGMTGMTGAKVFAVYTTICFLPFTLLFRVLPQQLENIELARRNSVRWRTITTATLCAFFTALIVGMGSFMLLSHYHGGGFYGTSTLPNQWHNGLRHHDYPLTTAHFMGEVGLDSFTQVNWVRIGFMAFGFVVVASLILLRKRFLKFPVHPVGYILILMTTYYSVVPYVSTRGVEESNQQSWLWASVFLAWLIKFLIIKYGGMNSYKNAKPFFIGLVVGAVFCIFAWNVVHLTAGLWSAGSTDAPAFVDVFTDHRPYSPRFY